MSGTTQVNESKSSSSLSYLRQNENRIGLLFRHDTGEVGALQQGGVAAGVRRAGDGPAQGQGGRSFFLSAALRLERIS